MAVRQKELQEIVALHRQRYPLMEPADYGKLLYQSEFGPEHMVDSPERVLEQITREWEKQISGPAPAHAVPENPEEIGNRLCRFHLTGGYDLSAAAPLLARLFFLTAKQHRGSAESLKEKLAWLEQYGRRFGLCAPALESWLEEYRRAGCPALHHSAAFREAYAPHYRILREEYAIYFPILYETEKRLLASKSVLLAIDGPCGGGKSSLAALLAELFPCRVLHMDDYYLPPERRSPGGNGPPAAIWTWSAFCRRPCCPPPEERPSPAGPTAAKGDSWRRPECSPPPPHRSGGKLQPASSAGPHYDLKIFLYCRPGEQLARLKRREGTGLEAYRQRWIPLEEAYYRTFGIESRCDLRFDNTPYFM